MILIFLVFKRVKIFNLQEQPIKLNLHTSKGNNLVLNSAFIKLAHGDIFTTSFTIYSENIKKSLFACIFEFLNIITRNFISNKILQNQNKNLFIK